MQRGPGKRHVIDIKEYGNWDRERISAASGNEFIRTADWESGLRCQQVDYVLFRSVGICPRGILNLLSMFKKIYL